MTEIAPQYVPGDELSADRRRTLRALYEKHRLELVRFVQGTFGSGPPEPEEVVQIAFANFAALPEPERVENPRAFLYQSVRNEVLQQRRKMKVRRRFAATALAENIVEAKTEIDAERILRAKQRLEIVTAAIEQMEPQPRECLILARIHGMSFADIARAKRMPESTVRKYVLKAMLTCQEALDEVEQ